MIVLILKVRFLVKYLKVEDTTNDNKTINKYEFNEEKPNTVLNLLNYLNMCKDKDYLFSNYIQFLKINNAISNIYNFNNFVHKRKQ